MNKEPNFMRYKFEVPVNTFNSKNKHHFDDGVQSKTTKVPLFYRRLPGYKPKLFRARNSNDLESI